MVKVNLNPIVSLSSQQFKQLCFANPEAKLELTAERELLVMSPTGGESAIRNTEIITNPHLKTPFSLFLIKSFCHLSGLIFK